MIRGFSTRFVSRPAFASSAAALQAQRRFNASTNGATAAGAAAGAAGEEKAKLEDTAHADRIKQLEKLLEAAKGEAADLKKDFLYQAAELDNVRRIGREDADKARQYSVTSFAKDMLEVVDTLEKGVEAMAKVVEMHDKATAAATAVDAAFTKQLHAVSTGVKMSASVLLKNLGKHGVEKMPLALGDKFDPNRHEALFKQPATDKCPVDTVSTVLKPGYVIKDRVLRAAQIGVAE